jgi:hypothetical protein
MLVSDQNLLSYLQVRKLPDELIQAKREREGNAGPVCVGQITACAPMIKSEFTALFFPAYIL